MAQITLQPHTGVNIATKAVVDLGQDRIFVDGQHVGYVARKTGAPINLIKPANKVPEELQAAIRDAVDAKYGEASERKLAMPVELPEDATDEAEEGSF